MAAKETSTQSSDTFHPPRLERFCAIFNRGEGCKLGYADNYCKYNRSGCGGDHPGKHCMIYPETKSLSVPEVKPMLSREPSDFIISSSLDSEALSQPSVLSLEALVVNVSLIASTSTQSVHTSLCSVIPTVSFSSSPFSQCYGEGIFEGVFTPIPKSVTTPVNVEVLRFELAGYPDLTTKDYLWF